MNVFPDPAAAAEACAAHILRLLRAAVDERGRANVALSGGSTPKLMFDAMVNKGFDWTDIHVYFVDERNVPPDHPDSNYGTARRHLIEPAGIRNVHRIEGELEAREAARRYAEQLPAQFDVVHLGMGSDAHTASLFPGEPLIDDRQGTAAGVYVEKLKSWRITLLPGMLLSAGQVVWLIAGSDKASALHAVRHGPYDPLRFPAQLIARKATVGSWFVDDAAAAQAIREGSTM